MKKKQEQVIFGVRAVMEAIDAGKELERVLLRNSTSNSEIFRDLKRRLREYKIPWQSVPVEKLNSVTRKNHQGVIAYISEISYADIEFILPAVFERGEQPFILLLDQVSDVRNFGAIARTAACAGVHAIVIPFRGAARITGEAVKTSAGALHSIPVCRHPDFNELLNYLRNSGLKIIGASEKGQTTVFRSDLDAPLAILMGSEDRGISPNLVGAADQLLALPVLGPVGSLNVSVAAGIIMYEVLRQRGGY